MNEYYVRVVTLDQLAAATWVRRCTSLEHGLDLYCRREFDQVFSVYCPRYDHRIKAYDDQEALRVASCLLGSQYPTDAIAHVTDDRDSETGVVDVNGRVFFLPLNARC